MADETPTKEQPPPLSTDVSAVSKGTSGNNGTQLPTDMSDHTLLGLLQASVDRLKTTVDTQQQSGELRDRDDKRTAIMLKLAQEQVERGRESYERQQRELERERARANDADAEGTKLQATVVQLEDAARVTASQHDRALQDIGLQLRAERGEKDALQATLDRVRKDLGATKAAATEEATAQDAKVADLKQQVAVLTARLNTLTEENAFLEGQRSSEVRSVAEREYTLNKTIGQLKATIAERDAELGSVKRNAFEQETVLTRDCEMLRVKVIQLEGMLQATDGDGQQRIHQLREEVRRLQERNEADHKAAHARERALEQETVTLTVNLRQAQQEINDLAAKDVAASKRSVEEVVQLHADRDALKREVATLERSLQETKAKANAQAVELRTDAEVARSEKSLAEQRHTVDLAVKRDEVCKLRDELSLTNQQLMDAQAAGKREEALLNDRIAKLEADTRQIAVERDGYQASVEKLDRHLRDNYAVRILEDEVQALKQQNAQLQQQLSIVNGALANLRVEADITETSRMRSMQEQVVEAQRRVAALERELRFSRPLLTDLVEAAQQASCLDAALERDVDLFFRQFAAPAIKGPK